MTNKLYNAYRFFKQHAGYVVGHRAEGAFALAKAEAWFNGQERYEAVIEPDDDCTGECIVAIHTLGERDYLASLGGVDPSDDYYRVIVAELAMEVMGMENVPFCDEDEHIVAA